MSSITIQNDETLGQVVNVNGIQYFDLERIGSVKRNTYWENGEEIEYKSDFQITHGPSGDTFQVLGGKHAGCGRQEWYVKGIDARCQGTFLRCFSLVECLRVIVSL